MATINWLFFVRARLRHCDCMQTTNWCPSHTTNCREPNMKEDKENPLKKNTWKNTSLAKFSGVKPASSGRPKTTEESLIEKWRWKNRASRCVSMGVWNRLVLANADFDSSRGMFRNWSLKSDEKCSDFIVDFQPGFLNDSTDLSMRIKVFFSKVYWI